MNPSPWTISVSPFQISTQSGFQKFPYEIFEKSGANQAKTTGKQITHHPTPL
jgi:hypothetical protein